MAKPEWGAKRQCAACGVRFYDLGKEPIVCPECGATFEAEVLVRGKRVRTASRPETVAKAAAVDVDLENDVEDAVDDDDDDTVVLDDEDDDAVVATPAADDADDEVIEAEEDVLLEDDDDEVELDETADDDDEPRLR